MKRKISLVIALVPSFVMMFGSIARAEETKVQITVTTSESAEIEVIKVPLAETDNPDSSTPLVKVKIRVFEEKVSAQCVPCPNGVMGYMRPKLGGGEECVPGCGK